MKKIINTAIFSVFVLISFFLTTTPVSANSISNIEMDVYIDANGNASVTEIWKAYLNQGTESYRTYTDLDNSTIYDFSVSDETGTQYENLSSWNTGASFDQKAYKNGFHYISGGVELCWGISEYGNKIYTLKYKISNFVTQYADTQGIYFNFIHLNESVSNVEITIRSDQDFSLANARIWGFGNNGTTTFENGKIVLNSNGNLSASQSMVVLVRFESNLFHTSNTSSKSFDDIYDSAMSDVNDDEFEDFDFGVLDYVKLFGKVIGYLIMMVIGICLHPVNIILIIYFVLKNYIFCS